MRVKDIYRFLDTLFPFSSACEFDNVGLLIGQSEKEVKTAVIALDCTDKVIDTAIKNKAELIITHHPVIFDPLKSITNEDIALRLIKNGISVISAHTNMDMGDGGVNDCLADALDIKNTEKLICSDGFIIRQGNLKTKMTADEFAIFAEDKLGLKPRYNRAKNAVSRVVLCSGSGGETLREAINIGADALITADVKHHIFLEAEHRGISVFDCGHFHTENVVVGPLTEKLIGQFPEIHFIKETDSIII